MGIGGPALYFGRPERLAELERLLAWAQASSLTIFVVGLGSNVLAADPGVDGLVLRLSGELATVEIDGTRLTAGGGAANAVSLHRARAAGLGGMEFACAIPGTAGGGVRMNAGAYGRDWADIVERVQVVGADGAAWLTPAGARLLVQALVPRGRSSRRPRGVPAHAAGSERDQA